MEIGGSHRTIAETGVSPNFKVLYSTAVAHEDRGAAGVRVTDGSLFF